MVDLEYLLWYILLWYFNVVGLVDLIVYDVSLYNFFLIVFEVLFVGKILCINGDDYDMEDGMNVCDYVYVGDIVVVYVVVV